VYNSDKVELLYNRQFVKQINLIVTIISLSGSVISVEVKRVLLNHLNTELNPICHVLALLGAHHILHVSRIRVNTKVQALLSVEMPGISTVRTHPIVLHKLSYLYVFHSFLLCSFLVSYLSILSSYFSPFSVSSSCYVLCYNSLRKYISQPALTALPIKNINLAFGRALTISVSEGTRVF
jgi:hypothetical protein